MFGVWTVRVGALVSVAASTEDMPHTSHGQGIRRVGAVGFLNGQYTSELTWVQVRASKSGCVMRGSCAQRLMVQYQALRFGERTIDNVLLFWLAEDYNSSLGVLMLGVGVASAAKTTCRLKI